MRAECHPFQQHLPSHLRPYVLTPTAIRLVGVQDRAYVVEASQVAEFLLQGYASSAAYLQLRPENLVCLDFPAHYVFCVLLC